jgi:UDP-N-acetylmuramate--alanine ligase
MSALARILLERGCLVTGCDAQPSPVLDELAAAGVGVLVGHDPEHLAGVEVLTASPAVAVTHPEIVAARERGLEVLTRAQVLAQLGALAPMVGFAGTHGKTTTTSMAVHVWRAGGRDPSWLLGAPVRGVGPSGHWREGAELLAEVDESYGTFAEVAPAALGVTNVDADHLDFYGTLGALERAFGELVARTTGPVVLWRDNAGADRVASGGSRPAWGVGRLPGRDVRVRAERFEGTGSHFELDWPGGSFAVHLRVPGELNVANAALTAAVGLACGLEADAVADGLGRFTGAPRRFEVVATRRGTTVVDDYAHLPAEVAATIAAARSSGFTRIAAVFQPHRVTRTVALAPQFAGAFAGVQSLVVTDIYSAGEPNPDRVTGELVADAVREGPAAPTVTYAPTLDEAVECLRERVGECDLILVLGAGDVAAVIPRLLEELER